mgnify:CR=1 FL=1
MIRPHKYMDLDLSLVNISARIIELLMINKVMTMGSLKKQIERDFTEMDYFIYSIDFLFLFDKIAYDIKNDLVRLNNEII